MTLLAIDPGSNKCGAAVFKDGVLFSTVTITTTQPEPLSRRISIAKNLADIISRVDHVVSEEPFLLGRSNNGMQRLLGYIEYLTEGRVSFIHPMTLKKILGHGSKDKLEVALAAGALLSSEKEQDLLADLIEKEEWDATDAIAIGITYIRRLQ